MTKDKKELAAKRCYKKINKNKLTVGQIKRKEEILNLLRKCVIDHATKIDSDMLIRWVNNISCQYYSSDEYEKLCDELEDLENLND